MGKVDYRIIRHSKRVRLQKNDEVYKKLYVKVKNESRTAWWDGRGGEEKHRGMLRVAPTMIGTLSKRYFEFLSIGHYTEDQFFHRVYRKGKIEKSHSHIVDPGESVLLKLFIRARTYSPIGKKTIKVGLVERDSRKELNRHPGSKSGKVRILPVTYKDARLDSLKTIGEVEYTYCNNAYELVRDYKNKQAIIMAVWKRVDRLPVSLDAFLKQKGLSPVLYLWVNNREYDRDIKQIIHKTPLPVKAYFSPSNIGGYGRFYLAKDIADLHRTVIFIDDDQVPKASAFKILTQEHSAKSIWGPYATRIPLRDDYWFRDEIKPGQEADYIATSGMICGTSIFKDTIIFECPKKYWFIEDLWLCYVAQSKYGWSLKKSTAEINTVEDEIGQWRPMIDLKNEFYKYLIKRGMRIHERAVE